MNINISKRGAPVVNHDSVSVVYENENCMLLEIDMRSKWCCVGCTFSENTGRFGLWIDPTNRSLDLAEGVDKDESTELEFTDASGWEIFLAECSRYTLRVALLKKENTQGQNNISPSSTIEFPPCTRQDGKEKSCHAYVNGNCANSFQC